MTAPLRQSYIDRIMRTEAMSRDRDARAAEMELCRRDPARWITNWCWTFDPRLAGDDSRRAWMPFALFPRQVEMVRWFDHVLGTRQDGVLEKSRDIGFTWVFGAWALHKWLFVKGHTTTFGSRKAEYVDVIGDSKSFFERLRMIYRALPPWMMPPGFEPSRHDKSMLLMNPANGNTISGESGDSMGRGNRAQPLDAKVLTPAGWVNMGDIRVGDTVVGAAGQPVKVLAVHPRGEQDVYFVSFSDGSSTRCCGDHVWRVTDKYCRKVVARDSSRTYGKRFRTMTTSEMCAEGLMVHRKDAQTEVKFQIPVLSAPVAYAPVTLPLDPYLMGSLIGDGAVAHVDKTSPGFTTADQETVSELRWILDQIGCDLRSDGSAYGYRIADRSARTVRYGRNPVKAALIETGLAGCRSDSKFIPDVYKRGDVGERLALIQGLLDTDGWCTPTQGQVNFATISLTLARDLIEVVQSLGGTARMTSRLGGPHYFPGGRAHLTRMSYQVTLCMPENSPPFRLKRKLANYRERSKYRPSRGVVSVVPDGHEFVQCITVDADDSLYVTDDFVVTHNCSIYLLDEAAFIERADTVDTATLATANCRIWGSTVNGMGNLFAKKRHDPGLRADQVFRFHWRDDPRKSEAWADETRRKVEDWKFASEYDIDYSASVEGICVPARWVEASRRLQALLRERGDAVRPSARGVGGLDVGAGGSGKSVFVSRHGVVVGLPVAWGDPDTIETAHRGIGEAMATTCALLNYDSVGVGTAVTAVLNRTTPGLSVKGVNVGAPPTEDVWPDGMMAKEKFANRKAELWSKMRERFKTTYEHVLFLEGNPRGIEHAVTDCIALPEGGGEALTLASQISLPKQIRDERGKVMIEKKADLARRGISSPDYAEALVLTFAEEDDLDDWRSFGRAVGMSTGLPGSWGGLG